MTVSAIVLAAGKGTRMKSELPKPLHLIRGRSMLAWVIEALEGVELDSLAVVVGHARDLVVETLGAEFDRPFLFADQKSQRGTGDAASVGLSAIEVHDNSFAETDHVIVVPGDTPLLTGDTIRSLLDTHLESGAAATVITAVLDDPTGYGRIVRNDRGGIAAIVEQRDADADQRSIREINGGMYCFRRSLLGPALRLISTDNAQGELYLTDAIGVLAEAGHPVQPLVVDDIEISGVNDRAQLGAAAAEIAARIAERHMRNGVTIVQPSSTVIDATCVIEPDVTVHGSTTIQGSTVISAGAVIGPNSHLVDAVVGERAVVESSTVRGTSVAAGESVGPYEHVTSDHESN